MRSSRKWQLLATKEIRYEMEKKRSRFTAVTYREYDNSGLPPTQWEGPSNGQVKEIVV